MTITRSPITSRRIHALGWLGRRPGRRRRPARAARAVTLIGVAASLTLGSGAAVAQATDAPGLPVKTLAKSCDLGFMPTKPTVTGPSILGNAFAVCDVPPERHELTLSLQHRQGGTWKTAESATSTAIPTRERSTR